MRTQETALRAQLLSGFGGALGKVEQVAVDLDGRDARDVVDHSATVEHAAIVGADDLDVGAASVAAWFERVGAVAGIAADVDTDEAEAREAVEGVRGREPGEGMVDPSLPESSGGVAGQLEASAGHVTGDDVVAVKAVLVGPRIEEQVGVARPEQGAIPLKQRVSRQPSYDPRDASGVEISVLAQLLLTPPARGVQQQDARHPGALRREGRGRTSTLGEGVGAPLDPDVQLLVAQVGVAGKINPVQAPLVRRASAGRRHERHDEDGTCG